MRALGIAGLISAYLILAVASNIGLKLSAISQELRGFTPPRLRLRLRIELLTPAA